MSADASVKRKLELVEILVDQSNYEGALRLCNEVIAEDARSFEAHSERARINHQLGRPTEALLDLQVLIELRPESPTAYLRRSTLNMELGYDSLAIEDLTFVIASGEEYFLDTAYFYRAVAYLNLSKKELAMKDCQKLPHDFAFFVRTKNQMGRYLTRDDVFGLASSL
jgi:tetratricopeptide (TPR) repeat protein